MGNVFVQTNNVLKFNSAMKERERSLGEPTLLAFTGPAGRGKTTTARYFAAKEGWTYCRVLKGWRQSELWMLQDMCFELQVDPTPKRKQPAFNAIVDTLRKSPRTVVVDEADKLNDSLLEWIRDIADVTFAPFALVGEKGLIHMMKHERRIWSRTVRHVEFEPIKAQDVFMFAQQAEGLKLTMGQAEMLQQAAEGDFRPVCREIRRIAELCRVNGCTEVTDDMVQKAIKDGLRG
ncbi:MAG: ATP-binding protein [Candidatus Margulisiibacteriota bacterium]